MGELNRAFLVPQAGLQRDTTGPFVKVVDAEGKVAQKRVTAEGTSGGNWIVTSGIAEGDQLIVSNFAKARPGTPVKIVAAETAPENPQNQNVDARPAAADNRQSAQPGSPARAAAPAGQAPKQ
jgi:membrane fusion protein, multidrug efflux system